MKNDRAVGPPSDGGIPMPRPAFFKRTAFSKPQPGAAMQTRFALNGPIGKAIEKRHGLDMATHCMQKSERLAVAAMAEREIQADRRRHHFPRRRASRVTMNSVPKGSGGGMPHPGPENRLSMMEIRCVLNFIPLTTPCSTAR